MTTRSLFGDDEPDPPPVATTLPYQPHSVTSREAALAAAPNAGTLRAKILAVIRVHGPITDEWIQTFMGLNPSTQRPRRIELVDGGHVRDSGQKGKTSSGRSAVLWEAVPE